MTLTCALEWFLMKNMRGTVKRGYEEGDYVSAYRLDKRIDSFPLWKSNFGRLVKHLRAEAKILDLGCGPGIPFDRYLVEKGFDVTGVDTSQKHIEMARLNVPKANFIRDDISSANFARGSFDAVISLYTIFHIPREEHGELLQKIRRLLRDDGLILVTMGTEHEENVGEFIGSQMAWSSYSLDENLLLVERCGFSIIHWEEEGKKGYPEHHLWILARKEKSKPKP